MVCFTISFLLPSDNLLLFNSYKLPMKIRYIYLAGIAFVMWISFIGFLAYDIYRGFGSDIGIVESLKQSGLARGMFYDIGLLSTVLAYWIAFETKIKVRWPFSIATLFMGSLAFLPYLTLYLIDKDKKSRN